MKDDKSHISRNAMSKILEELLYINTLRINIHWVQMSIQRFNVISLKGRGNNVDSTSVCPVGRGLPEE